MPPVPPWKLCALHFTDYSVTIISVCHPLAKSWICPCSQSLQNENFNAAQTWAGNIPYVLSADYYFLWAVDVRAKKKKEQEDREMRL